MYPENEITHKQKQFIPCAGLADSPAHEVVAAILRARFGASDAPVLVAIGGPGGTGKTTFALALARILECAAVLGLDDYKTSRIERAARKLYGPHPEANQMDLLRRHLEQARRGEPFRKPVYCRQRGIARPGDMFMPERYVLVEGETATYRDFADLMGLSVFIDADWKTQLNTRIGRDIDERGYTPQKAIETFLYSNLCEYGKFGVASKHWADVHLYCDSDYRLTVQAVADTLAPLVTQSPTAAIKQEIRLEHLAVEMRSQVNPPATAVRENQQSKTRP